MTSLKNILILLLTFYFSGNTVYADSNSSNGLDYPKQWQDWAVLAVSFREDNQTIRSIVGNAIALNAARTGHTDPWPDGAILGKAVWNVSNSKEWPAAKIPSEFIHVEFMFRNEAKYIKTHGWGWGRWIGYQLKPFNEGMESCILCHTPVKSRDWVYTEPAKRPLLK